MARRDRKALADMRAMEEQGERANPVNPRNELSMGHAMVPRTGILGKGATPAMGLSQVRGGGKLEVVHHSDSDEEAAEEAGGLLASHIKGLHGAGYLKKFHSGLSKHLAAEAEEKKGGINTGAYEGEGRSGGVEGCGLSGGAAHGVPVVGGITAGPGFYEASGGKKAKRAPSDARKKRGAMMSKLMKEHGMSLGEASKYIKEKGL